MKKIRLFIFAILLGFTALAFNTSLYAADLPTPTHTIIGDDFEEVMEGEQLVVLAESTLNITLALSQAVSGVYIQYQLFEGSPGAWSVYGSAIPIQKRGNFVLNYRAVTTTETGPTHRVIIRVDIPVVEDYPNVIRNNQIIKHFDTGEPIILPEYNKKDKEIRGVWVSTVSNIDIGQHTTDALYKKEITDILNRVQSLNMNTVFFQVRSMNDAMYPSELAPYSRYIKGMQGLGLDWDILRFVIDEAHKRGIELHAWLNPYRVANMITETTKEEMLATLHADNFAKQNPHLVLKQTNAAAGGQASFILDPGRPEVRDYLNDVIEELLVNYSDIDGIHFDDYFYVTTTQDSDTYTNYNPTNISSLSNWRRNNVDIMIKSVHDMIEDFNIEKDLHIKFGVSPGGIWANKSTHTDGSNTTGWQSYSSLYADTRKWVKEEWLDYIVPQLYWDFTQPSASFAVLVDWWADVARGTNVDLIIGLGFYRYTDNTPWEDENIIPEQLRYISQYEEVKGTVTFSYRTFNRALVPVTSTLARLANYYWDEPVDFHWESSVTPILELDAEMLQIKEDIEDIIFSINKYISDYEITSDENLTDTEKQIGEFFATKATLENINFAINDAESVINNRFKKEVMQQAKIDIEVAFFAFKELVYEGSFDPNRDSAAATLEAAIQTVTVIRNLVKDSNGKPKSELPKGEYFAETSVLASIDAVISEANAILADETKNSSHINEIYQTLKAEETTFRNSYFQGEMEESTDIIVSFDYGDGNVETVTLTSEGTVNKPADPEKAGFNFSGWYLDGSLFNFTTVIKKSITLVATFTEIPVEEVKDSLSEALTEFKDKVSKIETSNNRNPKELRKDHKYITPTKKEEVDALILEIEALLENELATKEEIITKFEVLSAFDANLDNEIVVGEQESNYRQIALIVGAVILGLAVVGGAAIFVVLKKRK